MLILPPLIYRNREHLYPIGAVTELKNQTNNYDTDLANTTVDKKDYKIELVWWHYIDNTRIEKIDNDEHEGELEKDKSELIMKTYLFE